MTAAIVYVVAVAATRYPLTPYGSWYLLPMLPFLFGAAGLVTADLWARGPWVAPLRPERSLPERLPERRVS